MKYQYCVSLTGHKTLKPNNLLGKEICTSNSKSIFNTPEEVSKLKTVIMNQFILPLCRENWNEIKENMFNIARLQNRVKTLNKMFPEQEINIYNQMLDFVVSGYSEHLNLENLEKQVYRGDTSTAARLIYKTKYIRIKAEYELYHLIIGKPDRKAGENYDNIIIDKIRELLLNEDATFKSISNAVNNYQKNIEKK